MHEYTFDTIERRGYRFALKTAPDFDMREPEKEHDGHGETREVNFSGYEHPPKRPGERVIYRDRPTAILYDYNGALEKATREGWGLPDDAMAKLRERLGREPTAREITVAAVDKDMDYIAGYYNDRWHWIGAIVELLDVDGNETGESESLWGLDDSDESYVREVCDELIDQLLDRLGDITEIVTVTKLK